MMGTYLYGMKLLPVMLLTVALGLPLQTASAEESDRSLYDRLGGDSTITALVDGFTTRLLADSTLKRLVVGSDADARRVYRRLAINQLCAETGGPCLDMFNINWLKGRAFVSPREWNRLQEHFSACTTELKIPRQETDELMALMNQLRDVILVEPKEKNRQ